MTDESDELPEWAPRVKQSKIRQLYDSDAKGIYDDELIEEVGYSLLFRCESFIAANTAVRYRKVLCARCSQLVERSSQDTDEVLACTCGWRVSWKRYFKTIQHKQLSGGEDVMGPFREFVASFPRTKDPKRRMVLIDQLIHGFHGYISEMKVRRPVCVNLIEGTMNQVVKFLDELGSSSHTIPEITSSHALWRRGIEANLHWYPALAEE